MANEKHREHFKMAMQLVQSMSDDELLRRIRSHGKGEYGLVFGVPDEKSSFSLDVNAKHKTPVNFVWDDKDFINVDLDLSIDAANDDKYDKAA